MTWHRYCALSQVILHPMKKSKELKLFIFSVLTLLVISSCERNPSENNKRFLGTWISTDLVDTVEFRTESDFYKTVGVPKDHFNYHISADSITIQYNGFLMILVQPTNHFYSFNGDLLTIDLEHCYGFRNQIISFTRK
jgi:hypothetical protein